ncbi:hypothetical protein Tco_0733659, partial [Tanacetum coccineum]
KKVEAMLKSAWTEKDQIDNLLIERRLMRSLEKFIGGRLYVVRLRYSDPMIQPEPEGSTQGYPLVSVEVLRFNTTAGNPVKKILLKLNLSDHRLFKDGGGDNQSLLLQYSRDGYVIEGELKEYEDSCEKSSVQIKFKVKDFIQAIKESSCKRRSKLAFENADFEFESRVDTFRDKEIYLVI